MQDLHVITEGEGPAVLLIHGSAADHTTWNIQRAGLRAKLSLTVYDRRGTGMSAPAAQEPFITVAQHAQDAARLIESSGAPVVVVGSSFGGVVALELTRRRPELVRSAVLIEPPLAATDEQTLFAKGFIARYDELLASDGGPAAAEYFLRSVLGDASFERMPRPFQERSKSLWAAIRSDCAALAEYSPDYASLSEVRTPVLLLGGERSAALYRPTLEALRRHLGNASLEILEAAGHMLHAEAQRRFNARLLEYTRAAYGVTAE